MALYRTQQLALAFGIAIFGIGFSASPGSTFSPEAQQLCSGDAMRLCSSEIPDIPRITACMHRKRALISPGCRALMDREAGASRKATQAAVDD